MAGKLVRKYDKEYHGELSPSELYVRLQIKGEVEFFKLSDLRWCESDDKRHVKEIKSYSQFEELRKRVISNEIVFCFPEKDETGTDVNKDEKLSEAMGDAGQSPIFPASFIDLINNFSTEYEKTSAMEAIYKQSKEAEAEGVTTIESGSKCSFDLNSKDWEYGASSDAFVYVKLMGQTKPTLVLKSKLIAKFGTEDKTLLQLNKKQIESLIPKRVTASTPAIPIETADGIAVERICLDKQFEVATLLAYNVVDFEQLQEKTYTLIPETDIAATETTSEVKDSFQVTSSRNIDRYFSLQTPVTVDVPNEKKAGETKKAYRIKAVNYEANPNGEYLKVQPKGTTAETIVKISDLYESQAEGAQINKDALQSYVGKKLYAKMNGVFVEIKPLTRIQASITFSEMKSIQPVAREDGTEISNNTFIKDHTGSLVREKDLAKPIGYSKVTEGDFDCYLIKGPDGNEYVVSKHAFNTQSFVENEVDGKKIRLTKPTEPTKLKRIANIADADIVQTTSLVNDSKPEYHSTINKCKVLSGRETEEQRKAREKELEQINKDFNQDYIAGKYVLPSVVYDADGKKVKLGEDRQRYKETEEVLLNDYGHDYYKNYSFNNIEYSKKDGKIQVKDGIKYDAGKATKNFLSKFIEVATIANTAIISSNNIVGVLFGIFVSVPATVAAFAVSAPTAAIVNKLIEVRKNHVPKPLKTKTEVNQPKWGKNIEKELSDDLEYLMSYSSTVKPEVALQNIQATFQSRKTEIAMLSASSFKASLEFNGKCQAQVDENNAATAREFMLGVQPYATEYDRVKAEIDKLTKKLEGYEKKGKDKKADKTRAKITALQAELGSWENKFNIAVAERKDGIPFKSHPSCVKLDRQAKINQAYVLVKGLGLSDEQLAEFGITEDMKTFMESLEFDSTTKKLMQGDKSLDTLIEEDKDIEVLVDKFRAIELGGTNLPPVAPATPASAATAAVVPTEAATPASAATVDPTTAATEALAFETLDPASATPGTPATSASTALGTPATPSSAASTRKHTTKSDIKVMISEYSSGRISEKKIEILIKVSKYLLNCIEEGKEIPDWIESFVRNNAKDFKAAVDLFDVKKHKCPKWLKNRLDDIVKINEELYKLNYTNISIDVNQVTEIGISIVG